MDNVRTLKIEDFDYALPAYRIADYPPAERGDSRLLVWKEGSIQAESFRNISVHTPPGALMVFNKTRVIQARIIFHKPTGASIEVFCLKHDPKYPDVSAALSSTGSVTWHCLVGNASAWPQDLMLEKQVSDNIMLRAMNKGRENGEHLIQLSWSPEEMSFAEVLHYAGDIPLPPYIKRKTEAADGDRYQTVYAENPGSVAAPTAGLHFTPEVLRELERRGVVKEYLTLHVGAGTFMPVKSEAIGAHAMHSEVIEVAREVIERLASVNGNPVIAVGTTSLRTLESLYWIGRKLYDDPDITPEQFAVEQWEPYETTGIPTTREALEALLRWMDKNNRDVLTAETRLLIAPSYTFRVADGLVTNFHQPRSTLLLLVAAFVGEAWKSIYTYALDNEFRFLSYGDACLLFRKSSSA